MRVLPFLVVLFATPAAAEAPGFVPPEWVAKPSWEDLQAVWPRDALKDGIDGRVVLSCTVTTLGLLEACTVREETPPGEGYAAAALLLTPSFVLKPATQNGKPVQTTIGVPVSFETYGATRASDLQSAPMVTEPVWEKAPSFAEMAAAWPSGADTEFGHVSMRCGFTREGLLRDCHVLTETPRLKGFGRAAKKAVAPLFKLRVTPELAPQVARASVNLAVRFTNPSIRPDGPRTIVRPKWITRLDPEKVVEVFPDAAAKAGVKAGRGVANCLVARDGRLTDCQPEPASPEGLGFSEAAVQVASVMVMNPWSDGGGPVDGVRIKLPVTFNLAPEEDAPPPRP